MKLYIQWTTDPPTDWVQIDSSEWASLPKKPVPTGGEVIDSTPGWVHAINCGATIMSADHYVVQDLANNKTMVMGWNDDPDDYDPADFWAEMWLIDSVMTEVPRLGPGANGVYQLRKFGGANILPTSPEPEGIRYLERTPFDDMVLPGQQGQQRRFADMNAQQLNNLYNNSLVKHGIGTSDALHEAHVAIRTPHTYMEWLV